MNTDGWTNDGHYTALFVYVQRHRVPHRGVLERMSTEMKTEQVSFEPTAGPYHQPPDGTRWSVIYLYLRAGRWP